MHLHILGICGTFMGGIAAIARAAGHRVTGCDANVYPPMSTQLTALGIPLIEGFDASQLQGPARDADVFVIGNVLSRGNPLVEAILDAGRPYVSGPQWLAEAVLRDRWVLAVAGTHGKTTTAAMLAWILEHAGLAPGFLIGGVPLRLRRSARLTDSAFFVIEADEYDTAFFDKRSKFVHYRPRTAILNNLEYDHADIFPTRPPSRRSSTISCARCRAAGGSSSTGRRRARPGARARQLERDRALRLQECRDTGPTGASMRTGRSSRAGRRRASCASTTRVATTSSMRWPRWRRRAT
jgi:UDP-N-acetylmuramate-alanine ligase